MYEIVKDGKIMPHLLECPYCNSHEQDVAVNDDNAFVISCEKCGATVWGKTLLEAAAKWNTRGGRHDTYATFTSPPLLWCKARRLRDDGKWGGWVHGYVTMTRKKDADDLWQINDGTGVMLTIDPATVCEFTGIRDANGSPVYNGDIMRRFDKERRYIVSYHDGSFWAAATPPEANDAPITVWGLVHNYAAILVSNLFDTPDAYSVAKNE